MNTQQTIELLQEYYNINTETLPPTRIKSLWEADNKYGFFMGIIRHGQYQHISRLHFLLNSNQFDQHQEFSTKRQLTDPQHQPSFIDIMFAYYILPFHKSYSDASVCNTPVISRTSSRSGLYDAEYVPEERELTHTDLKDSVLDRDKVCLFCWEFGEVEAAHLFAQKSIALAYDEPSLFVRAGMQQKHEIRNGLLLCKVCHSSFDRLKLYVDVLNDKLILNVVNYSILPNDGKHMEWENTVRKLQAIRSVFERHWADIDRRKALQPNGEMALYFVKNNPNLLPNKDALRFHKTACLIWRMSGGAEPNDEYCSDDEELGPVDTQALKLRFNVHDSHETLQLDC